MRSATGRWVSGADFFDREPELRILENRAQEGNHVLLTGQRRMGKTQHHARTRPAAHDDGRMGGALYRRRGRDLPRGRDR